MAVGNGLIPLDTLTVLSAGRAHRLRADAAASYERMAADFRRDMGYALAVTDAYRDLLAQYAVKAAKGFLAATPGTSEHGWALACDYGAGVNKATHPAHRWMDEHAHEYGWVNPAWAQTWKFEPWHWEYVPALDRHDGIGEAFLPRPTPTTPAPPTRTEDDDVESFRIRVDAKTNGVKNASANTIFLCRFGPEGVACFQGLSRDDNANLDRAGVPVKQVNDNGTWRDFSEYEKDSMRASIIRISQNWSIQ